MFVIADQIDDLGRRRDVVLPVPERPNSTDELFRISVRSDVAEQCMDQYALARAT